jgi:hypothetical protein
VPEHSSWMCASQHIRNSSLETATNSPVLTHCIHLLHAQRNSCCCAWKHEACSDSGPNMNAQGHSVLLTIDAADGGAVGVFDVRIDDRSC